MVQTRLKALLAVVFCALLCFADCSAAEPGAIVAKLENHQGTASIASRLAEPYRLAIDVDPKTDREPLTIRVELPTTGRSAWPVADVEVRDAHGRALAVRRSGIEWDKLLIAVPAVRDTYFVQAVTPPGGRPQLTDEKERHLADQATGLSLAIARWHDGRRAALSIRFDDSHPTHLSKAIPILREYGFRGTFMVNPGGREPGSRRRSDFDEHRAEWEAVATRGDQEFANHSAHHRGAIGDEDAETEIGGAAKTLWSLLPGKSPLMALNLGGGTQWETTRTLRYYLDKYHLFDASGSSTGMDDTYGNRVGAFRQMLEQHIARGLWYRVHYHYIGEGLSSSEANFRAVLEIAKERAADLWIAGMAEIYKYQTERNGSKLILVSSDPQSLRFKLSCPTDRELYDQALTIEAALPDSWPPDRIAVENEEGKALAARTVNADGRMTLRFEAAPRTAVYTVGVNR